ncbi:hypothetical protein ACFW1P_02705 [Paenibacillus sp. NPDC058910]|uniref:hypothetical protein n=1 Tax=unclassified Paenibacillus TaxID=185978 RepID=UPI0036B4FADC
MWGVSGVGTYSISGNTITLKFADGKMSGSYSSSIREKVESRIRSISKSATAIFM